MPLPLNEICRSILLEDEDALLGACEIVRYFKMKPTDAGGIEPWASLILANPPEEADIAKLRVALLTVLEAGGPRAATTAAFALGILADKNLIPTFRTQLQRRLSELMAANAVTSQLVVALSNSGESIISENSHSITSPEKTIRDARSYLARQGHPPIPW